MRNTTRTLQATMAACLLGASLLAGCAAPASSGSSTATTSEDAARASDEMTDEELEEGADEAFAEEIDPSTITSEFPVGEHIDLDQVLYDENGLKVTATGFGPVLYYAALNIDVQNTGDQEIDVFPEGIFLNGWVWDASLVGLDDGRYEEGLELTLKPGETKSCGIGFANTYYLEPCSIGQFAQIGFGLGAYSTETAEQVAMTPELVVNIPGSEEYVQTYDDSGTVAYDDGGIRVIARGIAEDGFGSYDLPVFVENLSEKNIVVQPASLVVNGTPMPEDEMYQIAEVAPGKRAIGSPWIEQLAADSKVEISFRITELDQATYEEVGEIAVTEPMTLGGEGQGQEQGQETEDQGQETEDQGQEQEWSEEQGEEWSEE